jgi:hypothetical protein
MKQVRISKYLGGMSFLSLLPVFLVVPVVLVLVVVAPSPAHATGTTFDLRYEMQWGNVNVGEVIKCGLTSKPTGGHRLKSRWTKKERKIDDTIIFIAEIEPGLYLPVRIEIKTFLGKITTRLVMTSLSIKAIADDAG